MSGTWNGSMVTFLSGGDRMTRVMLIRLTPNGPIRSVWAWRARTFPRRWPSSRRSFRDEAACRRYLAACRWAEGYQCWRCQHLVAFELPRRGLWQCKACGHQSSVTAGTVLHGTRTPLTQWFWAAYWVPEHTPGLSALQRQRQLGIARYETAWAIRHKLRRAMVRPDRELLKHQVEVDETYIGGPEVGLRGGRPLVDKALVVAAVEGRGTASGRVRLPVVPDASGASLTGFVRNAVERGALVVTEGGQGYAPLTTMGYVRRAVCFGVNRISMMSQIREYAMDGLSVRSEVDLSALAPRPSPPPPEAHRW